MTRIDFYFNVEDKFQQLAELAGLALTRARRLMVLVPGVEEAEQVERMLWTHAPTSFLPHCRGDHPLASQTPIVIDWRGEKLLHDDVLINLCPVQPSFFSRFHGVIEIVSTDATDRAQARERFRFYRDRGYEIRSHDIAGGVA